MNHSLLRGTKTYENIKTDAVDSKEDVPEQQRMRLSPRATEKIDDAFITKLIRKIVRDPENHSKDISSGAILVFLPGKAEIESLARKIQGEGDLKGLCHTVRLHSTASRNEQESAFLPPPSSKSKIILATNIAETSITIPGMQCVVLFRNIVVVCPLLTLCM